MNEPPGNDTFRAQQEQLITLAQAGSEEAFAALFANYSFGISRYLAGLISCPEDSDELALETFFRAWENLHRLRDKSRFKSWLYQIATNLAYDYGRRQKSKKKVQLISLDDCNDIDSPERFEENIIENELVRQVLEEIPPKYRTCLLLEIEGKLTRPEIAEVVEIDENSVGTYISYARQHCRQAYNRLLKERDTTKEEKSV
jgi:RNA polymerase sigma-70 factor, ECF subfamily